MLKKDEQKKEPKKQKTVEEEIEKACVIGKANTPQILKTAVQVMRDTHMSKKRLVEKIGNHYFVSKSVW